MVILKHNREIHSNTDGMSSDRYMNTMPEGFDASHYLTISFLRQVLAEAERTPLQESSRNLTYDLLCALANPSRADTRGLSHLAEVAERFAFSLLTHSQCEM